MARTLTRGGIIRGGNPSSGRAQPVLAGKFVNPGELAFVVGDERIAEGNGLSGDEQVVAADRLAGPFETGAEQAIGLIGGCVEGQDLKGAEHGFNLRRQPGRSLLGSPIAEFCRDDDAGTDLRFTNFASALRHPSLRIADEVRNDVGVGNNQKQRERVAVAPQASQPFAAGLSVRIPRALTS